VHDDLYASTLYLANRDAGLLIITCDLIGLHHKQVDALRHAICAETDVDPAHIMIACSHTHAGPATPCIRHLGRPVPEYLERLHDSLVQAAVTAVRGAVPAVASWQRVPVNVGVNRRELRNGAMTIGENESGAVLPYADMLAVDSLHGDAMAVAYCHPAHAVALGGDNLLISADWPGYTRRELQASLGPECAVLFLQGCCGDINCRERGWDGAERQGRRVAGALLAARARFGPFERAPVLAAAVKPLRLPLQPPPPLREAEAMLEEAERHLAGLPADANRGVRWMAEGTVDWCTRILDLARDPAAEPRTVRFDVQALRIGNGGIVGLPGEVFVQYARNIAAQSPLPITAVAAYANGNVGYIPAAADYPRGGYEVKDAIRYYGDTMPLPESEEMITGSAVCALRSLKKDTATQPSP
jgi:hypothetical protein